MNPFDAYTIKARIAPALLLLLPLAVTIYAWLPLEYDLSILGWLAAFLIAALGALAWEIGLAGRQIQGRLFARWGGAPTTQLLRHSDDRLNVADKARYHDVIRLYRTDLPIPTSEVELQNPVAADAVYEQAVAWLREQTRDARRFPLVADENANFGFHRNIYAHRDVGYVSSIVGVVGCAMSLLMPNATTMPIRAILGSVVSGMCAILIARVASEGRVREAGFTYAWVLIRAIDGFASKV